MELSKQVINFIKTFRGLIRDYKFDALYEEAYNIFISNTYFIGELTDAFLASGIDPVEYFHNEIPFNYLHGSKLKTYSMPDRIEWIGQEAFIHCKDLREIKLSKNLRYIGDGAFQNCMMLDIDLTQCPNLRTIGLNAFDVANMTIDSHDGIDFAASATMTSTNVFNLVVEASKQYTTVDKFYNAFGVEATFTKLETTGTNIQSAFTYTVEGVNYVAYFVYNENGVSIDDAHETIYPVVAVSINLTDDKIAAAKVITNATSHAWATAYYSSVDTFVGSLVGLDSNELATKTANNHKDYDTVASATYSSKGVFNYVLSACKQYVNTDKANLVGGNA